MFDPATVSQYRGGCEINGRRAGLIRKRCLGWTIRAMPPLQQRRGKDVGRPCYARRAHARHRARVARAARAALRRFDARPSEVSRTRLACVPQRRCRPIENFPTTFAYNDRLSGAMGPFKLQSITVLISLPSLCNGSCSRKLMASIGTVCQLFFGHVHVLWVSGLFVDNRRLL